MSAQHYWCESCESVTHERDMESFTEWNPDARRHLGFIRCPCGEREEFEEAYLCDECGAYFPRYQMEDATDTCDDCWRNEHPDTGDAETAHRERLKGYDS